MLKSITATEFIDLHCLAVPLQDTLKVKAAHNVQQHSDYRLIQGGPEKYALEVLSELYWQVTSPWE